MSARILALDLTGPGGGAALLLPSGLSLSRLPPGAPRGRLLMPAVEALLGDAAIAPRELDAIACAVGPGSFTGIRIGIATAATIAYAAGRPAVAVGSLHGIAAGAPAGARRIAVAVDARRGRIFGAQFERTGDRVELRGAYLHAPAEEFAAMLPRDTHLLGDALRAYPRLFAGLDGDGDALVQPDAVARIGADLFARGEAMAAADLRPLYLRLSDPEIRFPAPS